MIFIAHRGNINGPNLDKENSPKYIDRAINIGFDAEIDIWIKEHSLFLGHDKPEYSIDFKWLQDRISKLWIHCKNVEAIVFFQECAYKFNYFWHQNDDITLTSKNYIWTYPGKQPIKNSIAILPEINNDDISYCIGACSDYIQTYKIKNE